MIAVKVHAGQQDKAGATYILHPLRVMMKMNNPREMITAVLHDVIEDTACTFETLRQEGFSDNIISALDHLTRRKDEKYEAFIERVKKNELASAIKLADLEDNVNTDRLGQLTEKDRARLEKYRKAFNDLAGQSS